MYNALRTVPYERDDICGVFAVFRFQSQGQKGGKI